MIQWMKYGTASQKTSTELVVRGGVDYKAAPTLASGDVKVSKDGGALANITTLPTVTPSAGIRVEIAPSSTELECKELFIQFIDQTSPKEWEDRTVRVLTYGHASAYFPGDIANPITAAQVNAEVQQVVEDNRLDQLMVDDFTGATGLDFPVFGSVFHRILDATGSTSVFDHTEASLPALAAAIAAGGGGSGVDRLLLQETTIATLASQTSFTLTAGSADNHAYRGCTIVIEDASTATQKCVGIVDAYTGSTKTITLLADPGVFTMAAGDKVYILAEKSLKPTNPADHHVDVDAGGAVESTGGGGGAAHPEVWYDTTVATKTSQQEFTLANGPSNNDALYDCIIILESGTQRSVQRCNFYAGGSRTVTLDNAVSYTFNVGDRVVVLASSSDLSDETGIAVWNRDSSQFSSSGTYGGVVNLLGQRLPLSGTLSTLTAAQVNAEVDAALDTAIPGSPTANSVNERLKTLDDNYTSTRAAFLDKLNVTGNVASSAEVTAIQNNTKAVITLPPTLERPDSGSAAFKCDIFLYDTTGNMEAPDSTPTLAAENESGTDRSANLSAVSSVSTGHYTFTYTVASGHAIEQVRITVTVVEGGATRKYGRVAQVVDTTAVDFTSADRTKLDAIHAKLPPGTISDVTTAQVNAEVDTAIADARLDELLSADSDIDGAAPPAVGSVFHELMSKTAGSFTFDQTTDSLEAIRDRGDAAWGSAGSAPHLLLDTTVASVESQTSLILTAGPTVDDALLNQTVVLYDASAGNAPCVRKITDYVQSAKRIILDSAAVFTVMAGDGVKVLVAPASATAPTAGENAAATWNALTASHTAAGTFGKRVFDIGQKTDVFSFSGSRVVATLSGEPVDLNIDQSGVVIGEVLTVGPTAQALIAAALDLKLLQYRLNQMFTATATSPVANSWAALMTESDGASGRRFTAGALARTPIGTVLHEGTAQSGGLGTIRLAGSASAQDDFYNKQLVHIHAGAGAGQARIANDYTGSTRDMAVDNWVVVPDGTSQYRVYAFGVGAGAGGATASEISDAVWDEARSGHVGAGTFGEAVRLLLAHIRNKVIVNKQTGETRVMDEAGTGELLARTVQPGSTVNEVELAPS